MSRAESLRSPLCDKPTLSRARSMMMRMRENALFHTQRVKACAGWIDCRRVSDLSPGGLELHSALRAGTFTLIPL